MLVKREDMFIKDNIPRYIYTARGSIKALVPFMQGTVAKKNTLRRAKSEFIFVISSQMRPTSTAKHTEQGVIGFSVKKTLKRTGIINDPCRHAIYKICGGKESIIPKFKRNMSMG